MSTVEIIGWTGTMCQVCGLLLSAHKKIACWSIWILSNIFLITYSIMLDLRPILILNIVFIGFNLYGWYKWKKGN